MAAALLHQLVSTADPATLYNRETGLPIAIAAPTEESMEENALGLHLPEAFASRLPSYRRSSNRQISPIPPPLFSSTSPLSWWTKGGAERGRVTGLVLRSPTHTLHHPAHQTKLLFWLVYFVPMFLSLKKRIWLLSYLFNPLYPTSWTGPCQAAGDLQGGSEGVVTKGSSEGRAPGLATAIPEAPWLPKTFKPSPYPSVSPKINPLQALGNAATNKKRSNTSERGRRRAQKKRAALATFPRMKQALRNVSPERA